jgi:hypothetical protein
VAAVGEIMIRSKEGREVPVVAQVLKVQWADRVRPTKGPMGATLRLALGAIMFGEPVVAEALAFPATTVRPPMEATAATASSLLLRGLLSHAAAEEGEELLPEPGLAALAVWEEELLFQLLPLTATTEHQTLEAADPARSVLRVKEIERAALAGRASSSSATHWKMRRHNVSLL